jgi:general secretion pathway protein E
VEPLTSSLELTESFDAEYLEYHGVFPIDVQDELLRVAVTGDPCAEVLADLQASFGHPLRLEPVERDELEEAVRRTFAAVHSVDALVKSLDDDLPADGVGLEEFEADTRDLASQPPVIRYVNLLIREAHESRASDVHIESTSSGVVVRYRIDGVLTSAPAPPDHIHRAVVSRVKLIAELDIAERRVPQDGRIRIRLEDRELDLRVSTVPTLFGESVVMRLLDHGGVPAGLDALGMDEDTRRRFAAIVQKPHGIVLATGPTGSGKTTTLYGALRLRDASREKIITVEDPIEYQLPGVTQVPVNTKAGMTFAAGLRSILRQDPDIVMVGEMRDAETARIAVQAAMTGHLVFSTVHTNDAPSAVTRMVDLGVEPYMVAATLQGVLAQRLVRRVCRECSEPSASSLGPDLVPVHSGSQRVGVGCALCRHTGFTGRVGLYELLFVDDVMKRAIGGSPDADRLRELALEGGMRPLYDDGRQKVLDGTTTAEEVMRAVQQ